MRKFLDWFSTHFLYIMYMLDGAGDRLRDAAVLFSGSHLLHHLLPGMSALHVPDSLALSFLIGIFSGLARLAIVAAERREARAQAVDPATLARTASDSASRPI